MTIIIRLLAMIGIVWIALSSVTLTALLAASWRVRKWEGIDVYQTECPMCHGDGQVIANLDIESTGPVELVPCPLCDGESSLMLEEPK